MHRTERVNEEKNKILEKILEEFDKDIILHPPNLRGIDRKLTECCNILSLLSHWNRSAIFQKLQK